MVALAMGTNMLGGLCGVLEIRPTQKNTMPTDWVFHRSMGSGHRAQVCIYSGIGGNPGGRGELNMHLTSCDRPQMTTSPLQFDPSVPNP